MTGVQPIALGRATRITQFLLTAPKEYVGVMHLHKIVKRSLLEQAIKKFIGEITQLPPLRSAVKRKERKRKIYEIEILEIKEKEVLFRINCQAGTYVRKFCHDLGQELKVGAHLIELRRTRVGPFTEKERLVSLTDLQDAVCFYKEGHPGFLKYCLQPLETAISFLPKIWVLDTTILSLTHGRDLAVPGISKFTEFSSKETVAVFTLKDELIAIGQALISSEEIKKKEKGLVVKINKVFLSPLTS